MQTSLYFGNNNFFTTFNSQLANSSIKENQIKQNETNLNYRKYMTQNTEQIKEINFISSQKNSSYQ